MLISGIIVLSNLFILLTQILTNNIKIPQMWRRKKMQVAINEIMGMIRDNYILITRHGYRHTLPKHVLFTCERDNSLEAMLASKSGDSPDNHIAYSITLKDGSAFAISFNDNRMTISLALESIA